GDSYVTMGTFSTRTEIIDLKSGKVLFGLEKLTVSRDGHPFQAVDFNFWGVTFANDNRHFYATLGTGDRPYLIQGEVVTRTASVAGDKPPAVPPGLTTGAALPTHTWEVPADGTGAPTLLEPGAWSTGLTRLDHS